MQNEKALMQLPIPAFIKRKNYLSTDKTPYWYNSKERQKPPVILYAETMDHQGQMILVITFFSSAGEAIFRIFQGKTSHFNQDISNNKRTEATLAYIAWNDNRFHKKYKYTKESADIIKSFLEVRDPEIDAVTALMEYQKQLAADILKARYDKIKKSDDIAMLQIRDVPKDFQNWMDEIPLARSRYIFYEYHDRAVIDGYCTVCRHDVKIRKPHHNTQTKCPNCGKTVTYKTISKSYHIVDEEQVALIQKIKDGYVIRYFRIQKYYYKNWGHESLNYRNPEYGIHELAREFEDINGHQLYVWGDFRQTGEYRFCKDYSSSASGSYYIYNRNLKDLFRNERSPRKYFPFAEFLRNSGPVKPQELLTEIIRTPQLEYMAKLKLYRFIAGGINGDFSCNEVFGASKDIQKIIGVSKDRLPIIQRMNPTRKELQYFTLGLKYGVDQAQLLVEWLKKPENYRLIWRDNLKNLFKVASPVKLIRYIETQLKQVKGKSFNRYSTIENVADVVACMEDYIDDCRKLEYDLKNEFVILPRNLAEAHNEAAARLVEKERQQEQERFAKIADREIETNEIYAWESSKYLIRAPRDYDDLVNEGQQLHHCVGTYAMRVATGDSVVLFIREIENPDESFFTLEYRDDEISQCRGKNNCIMTPEVKKFVEQWERRVNQKCRQRLLVI
jgi:predicted RNA-binding Zn-ribbon protein involved in translation (DUF1610 family)